MQIFLARQVQLTWLALFGAALGYGIALDPESGAHGIPCLWKMLVGWECPGCGLSRAWALLVRGQFLHALKMNWLIYLLVPAILQRAIWDLRRSLAGKMFEPVYKPVS